MTSSFFKNESINAVIKDFLDKKLREFSGINYAYAIINKKDPSETTIITNKSDWAEIYIENKCQLTDPVVITGANRILPFTWDENIVITSGLKLPKVFNMARDYNIVSGYTFVVHDATHNFGLLSIMTHEFCDYDLEARIERQQDKLQMLLLLVHDKLLSLYSEMRRIGEKPELPPRIFSKRESEVLYFASLGKTYKEIAVLLGIKLTTVKFHSRNALTKLGVSNIRQGIKIAHELQLIKPVPL
ncbi:helix-turn-helix transcriptional regulator [Rouxiella chamberiensis]|uniref:helix-turn-helix transcriptional regulator n=1 Tax=Rouxiella chamberiensis TaxID=1513468 RepID=UPI0005D45EAA|nr:LuxR family transcriptional regulator [Rouxiella chamberiensis]